MKMAVVGIVIVLIAGMLHIMFIMFDYAYNDPDDGAFVKLRDSLNGSMNWEMRNKSYNNSRMVVQMFGIGRVAVLAVACVCFAIEVFGRIRIEY